MLLIDGVRYQEWTPKKEVEEFHPLVREHCREIFGQDAIDLDGSRLKSEAGIGSKPDWFVLDFGKDPQWYVVEVELSSHDVYKHVVDQVGRFIAGIQNINIQRKITEAIYQEIMQSRRRKADVEDLIGSGEIHKSLSDLISRPPVLAIVIESRTPELEEALSLLKYSPIKIVEFRTFVRDDAKTVHAHSFEPLCSQANMATTPREEPATRYDLPQPQLRPGRTSRKAGKVTFRELLAAGLVKDGQILYFHNLHNSQTFKEDRAAVDTSSNTLKYQGKAYSKTALAQVFMQKHGFFDQGSYEIQGPKYWKTEDDKSLYDLEERLRANRGDRNIGKTTI